MDELPCLSSGRVFAIRGWLRQRQPRPTGVSDENRHSNEEVPWRLRSLLATVGTQGFLHRDHDPQRTLHHPRRTQERHLPKPADCDHKWRGYREGGGNPLMAIFANDMIYAPKIVPFAMEWAWTKWKEGASDEETESGLKELFNWIDESAQGKPRGEFWSGAF